MTDIIVPFKITNTTKQEGSPIPYNGSGVYIATSLPGSWNPATTGSSATPADWNTLLADLSTALSTAICKDGQTTITGNIPFATHKITGLGDPSAAQDAATKNYVDNVALQIFNQQSVVAQPFIDFITVPNTVNNLQLTYNLTVSNNPTSLAYQLYDSSGNLDSGANYFNVTTVNASGTISGSASSGQTSVALGSLGTGQPIGGCLFIGGIQQTISTMANGSLAGVNSGNNLLSITASSGRLAVGPITGIRLLTVGGGSITGTATLYTSNT